jgi:hypothetical protein
MPRNDEEERSPLEHKKASSWRCSLCLDDDPQVRYRHCLELAKVQTLEAVEAHLYDALRAGTILPDTRIVGYVADRMAWLKDQVVSYSGRACPRTGAVLPWWETRRQVIARFKGELGPEAPPMPEQPPLWEEPPGAEIAEPPPIDLEPWHQALDRMVAAQVDDYTQEPEER